MMALVLDRTDIAEKLIEELDASVAYKNKVCVGSYVAQYSTFMVH